MKNNIVRWFAFVIFVLRYFFQLCAELKQVQTKLVQVEQSVHTQGSECDRQQQKIRELELELARNSTRRTTTTSLQEELQAERARLIAADKKVSATQSLQLFISRFRKPYPYEHSRRSSYWAMWSLLLWDAFSLFWE